MEVSSESDFQCNDSVFKKSEFIQEKCVDRKKCDSVEKCRTWLHSCSLSDDDESDSDVASSSITDTDISSEIEPYSTNFNKSDEIVGENKLSVNQLIGKEPSNFHDINVYKCRRVHIGDVTNVNGPIYINQFVPVLHQDIVIYNNDDKNKRRFNIEPRKTWLAQPPSCEEDVVYLNEPAKLVIISHSATEESYVQAENNLTVRLIQQFHIEGRKWNDIAYNFLIGADGTVYEGRGWGVMGAHTFGYNRYSLGICFIGHYVNKLPSTLALKKAKALIEYGVEIGKIDKDYKILGHCQCISTASPGRKLYEEIKTWSRWDPSVSVENPSPTAVSLLF